MKSNTALSRIMNVTGWTQSRMAKELGLGRQSAIANRLARENISIMNAMEMLNKMGYEIVFQPISGGRRKDGAFVIDGIDPPESGDSKVVDGL